MALQRGRPEVLRMRLFTGKERRMRRSRIAGEGDVEAHCRVAAIRPFAFPRKMKQRQAAEARRVERRMLLLRLEALKYHAGKTLAHGGKKVPVQRRKRIGV